MSLDATKALKCRSTGLDAIPHVCRRLVLALLAVHLKGPPLRRSISGGQVFAHDKQHIFCPKLRIVIVRLIEHRPVLRVVCPILNYFHQLPLLLEGRRRNVTGRYESDGGASRHGVFDISLNLRKPIHSPHHLPQYHGPYC